MMFGNQKEKKMMLRKKREKHKPNNVFLEKDLALLCKHRTQSLRAEAKEIVIIDKWNDDNVLKFWQYSQC